MNIAPLKSLWCDQICEQINISMLRMRVAIMMFYRMNITPIYWFINKAIEIGGMMKEKPAIAPLKYLVFDFNEWFKFFAFGPG